MPINFLKYLVEGGAGGRIQHPFELVKTGKELIELFRNAIKEINTSTSFLKFDGINVSLKYTDSGFAMDRGSSKELDIKGIRPDDLEDRFGKDHGLIEIGKTVISIFDSAYNTIKPELIKLGLIKNKNLLLNIEYINGKTNVIDYATNDKFLVIHGIREITPKNIDDNGSIKSRVSKDVQFDRNVLNRLIVKLQPFAKKNEFDVIGMIGIELEKVPDIDKVLSEKLTLNKITKSLSEWLSDASMPETPMSRQKYLDQDITNIPDELIGNYVIYYSMMKIGDEFKKNLKSDKYGDIRTQEGIIVNSEKYGKFKITGSFFIKSLNSKFNDVDKEEIIKEDAHSFSNYSEWGWISNRGKFFDGIKFDGVEDHEELLYDIIDQNLLTSSEVENFMIDPDNDTSFPLSSIAFKLGWLRWFIEKSSKTLYIMGKEKNTNALLPKLFKQIDGKFKKIEYDTVGVKSYSVGESVVQDLKEYFEMEDYYAFWGWILPKNYLEYNINKNNLVDANGKIGSGQLLIPSLDNKKSISRNYIHTSLLTDFFPINKNYYEEGYKKGLFRFWVDGEGLHIKGSNIKTKINLFNLRSGLILIDKICNKGIPLENENKLKEVFGDLFDVRKYNKIIIEINTETSDGYSNIISVVSSSPDGAIASLSKKLLSKFLTKEEKENKKKYFLQFNKNK